MNDEIKNPAAAFASSSHKLKIEIDDSMRVAFDEFVREQRYKGSKPLLSIEHPQSIPEEYIAKQIAETMESRYRKLDNLYVSMIRKLFPWLRLAKYPKIRFWEKFILLHILHVERHVYDPYMIGDTIAENTLSYKLPFCKRKEVVVSPFNNTWWSAANDNAWSSLNLTISRTYNNNRNYAIIPLFAL